MASTDALPIPRKNAAFRVYFPMLKNDGTILTGWTSPAASISKDGATAASATNTPAEIASSFGVGYLDLTSTEMNADCIVVKATVTNTGALAQVVALYPQEAGDIRVNPTYWNDQAVAAPNVNGVPLIDAGYWKGGAIPTPNVTGEPLADTAHWRGTQPNTLQSGRVDGSIGANNDKTGYALTSGEHTTIQSDVQTGLTGQGYTTTRAGYLDTLNGLVQAIWDKATSALTTAGSIGKRLLDFVGGASVYSDAWATDLASGYSGTEAGNLLMQDYLKSLLITADNVHFTMPVDPITGDLTVVRGDDYTVSSGRALPEWSSDDWTPLSLTTALSITLKARTPYSETPFEKAAAALSDTQARVELTAADTGGFAVGRDAYRFDLEAVLASGDVITLAQGSIHVIENVQ